MALTTTASAGVVPPSPAGRMPSGWVEDGTSLISVVERGQEVGARHGVVHERAGQHLAVGRIVEAMLDQRLADPLGDAAVGLAVDDQRVHGAADVVDGGVAHDRQHAGVGIDLHLADVAAIAVAGVAHGLVGDLAQRAAQVVWQRIVVRVRPRRSRTGRASGRCARARKWPSCECDVGLRGIEQDRGDAPALVDDRLRRLVDHEARKPHAAARMGAAAEFHDVGVAGDQPHAVDAARRAIRSRAGRSSSRDPGRWRRCR